MDGGSLRKKPDHKHRTFAVSTITRTALCSESQIPDEFDSHGNWIKRTDWVTMQGRRPVKVTYRTTYFVT
jgi:hypothetical protein